MRQEADKQAFVERWGGGGGCLRPAGEDLSRRAAPQSVLCSVR